MRWRGFGEQEEHKTTLLIYWYICKGKRPWNEKVQNNTEKPASSEVFDPLVYRGGAEECSVR